MLRFAFALIVALAAPPGLAQIVPIEQASEAPAADTDSTTVSAFAQQALRQAASGAAQRARPSPMLGMALRAATQPTVAVLSDIDVVVTLPPGWSGPQHASTEHLPRYALFTLENDAPRHPLAGAVVRVERVVGFEGIERERWLRGLTPYRYHGAGPIGVIAVPGHPFAVEVAGGGARGAVVFVRHHTALWAVGVEAPDALWARQRDALLALIRGVRLP
ncbi:hypothetical protein [Rubrivirga sp. IMCC43871]|uniref:hypothetical protein n=1 Tax=Rubrivirga sp. IMCC43871 TaxID=3391575 RepID=UPI00398FE82A